MYDISLLFFLAATFVAAGLVKGITGMGLPTVAMGLLGTLMPPVEAAALLLVPSLVTNVWQLLAGPAAWPLVRRLWPMLVGCTLGTVASAALLVAVNPRSSGVLLGSALLVYAAAALLMPALAVPQRLERWLSPLVGVVTGAITGATGVLVVPAVPYLQSLRLERDALVQALGLSFTVSTLALAGGLATQGALQPTQLGLSALAIVPALLGMALGQRLRARIRPALFRTGFLCCLALLGAELITRAWR